MRISYCWLNINWCVNTQPISWKIAFFRLLRLQNASFKWMRMLIHELFCCDFDAGTQCEELLELFLVACLQELLAQLVLIINLTHVSAYDSVRESEHVSGQTDQTTHLGVSLWISLWISFWACALAQRMPQQIALLIAQLLGLFIAQVMSQLKA